MSYVHELCSDWHAPYTVFIAPYSLCRGNLLKFTSLRNIHSQICATQHLQTQTKLTREVWSVTQYTSVNKYYLNSCLAHFNALWMEHIRSFRTGIMAEYSVMSTSKGTYGRIEQTSYVIREINEMYRAGRGEWVRIGIGKRWANSCVCLTAYILYRWMLLWFRLKTHKYLVHIKRSVITDKAIVIT